MRSSSVRDCGMSSCKHTRQTPQSSGSDPMLPYIITKVLVTLVCTSNAQQCWPVKPALASIALALARDGRAVRKVLLIKLHTLLFYLHNPLQSS